MISLPKLERQVASRRLDQMLDDLLRRGKSLPLQVRLRLSEPETQAAAALGLALRRVCELTYRPTPASIALLEALLDEQRGDGSFGRPAATAPAVAGLLGAIDQLDGLPGPSAPRYVEAHLEQRLRSAARLALVALRADQDASVPEALFEGESSGGLIGDEIDSAIVIWQLGLEPRFARAIRLHDLLHAIDARGLRHGRSTAQLVGRFDGRPHRSAALESAA